MKIKRLTLATIIALLAISVSPAAPNLKCEEIIVYLPAYDCLEPTDPNYTMIKDDFYIIYAVKSVDNNTYFYAKVRHLYTSNEPSNDIEVHKKVSELRNMPKFVDSFNTEHLLYIILEKQDLQPLGRFMRRTEYFKNDLNKLLFFYDLVKTMKRLERSRIKGTRIQVEQMMINGEHMPVIFNFAYSKNTIGHEVSTDENDEVQVSEEIETMPMHENDEAKKDEIWHIGQFLYYLAVGKMPVFEKEDTNHDEKLHKKRLQVPANVAVEFTYIMDLCFQRKKSDRITLNELSTLVKTFCDKKTFRRSKQPQTIDLDESLVVNPFESDVLPFKIVIGLFILGIMISSTAYMVIAEKNIHPEPEEPDIEKDLSS